MIMQVYLLLNMNQQGGIHFLKKIDLRKHKVWRVLQRVLQTAFL